MYVQLICNHHVVTYNKLQGVNPMFISAPRANYKNKQIFTDMKYIKQPCDVPQKQINELTQLNFVTLGTTIKTNNSYQTRK